MITMRPFMTRALVKLSAWDPDRGLLALACALTFLLMVQGVRYAAAGFLARGLAKSLKDVAAAPPKRDEILNIDKYDAILDKGILGKKSDQAPSSAKVFGIMGRTALIGLAPNEIKPYQVGEEVPGGEKILEIGPNKVVLEKDDKRRTATVFPDLEAKPAKEGQPPAPPAENRPGTPEDQTKGPSTTETKNLEK